MLDKIKYYWHVATDKYLVEMAYVEKIEGVNTIVEKKYIIYNDNDGSMDYTTDPKQATCFGFVLGTLVVKSLIKECKDLPNLQFWLVSVKDAMFIDTIQNGSAVSFKSDKKEAIDFAAEELVKKYVGKNPNVIGIGSGHKIDTEKKIHDKWIIIHVKDLSTVSELKKDFPEGKFKEFNVKIEVAPTPTEQK